MVTKLDRVARSLPDARAIADELTRRQVRLSRGGSVYDPHGPVGRLLFNVLAMVAEFEFDLIRLRTKEGMRDTSAAARVSAPRAPYEVQRSACAPSRPRLPQLRAPPTATPPRSRCFCYRRRVLTRGAPQLAELR